MPIDPLCFFPRGKGNNKLDQLQAACVTYPLLLGGQLPQNPSWYSGALTWCHSLGVDAMDAPCRLSLGGYGLGISLMTLLHILVFFPATVRV